MNQLILLQEIIQLTQTLTLGVELSNVYESCFLSSICNFWRIISVYLLLWCQIHLSRMGKGSPRNISISNGQMGMYVSVYFFFFPYHCSTCSLDLIALMVCPCLGQIISLLSLLSLLIVLNGLALHRFECSNENCLALTRIILWYDV